MEERYKVIHSFKDLEDNNYIYIENKDIYPREGLEPTKKRIKELLSNKNKIGKILIEKLEETEATEAEENTKTTEEDKDTEKTKEEVKEETETTE